jgi:hypothetical protein
MTKKRNALRKVPGWLGIGIITALNALWLVWGMGESFYEGWGVAGTPWFLFLVIGGAAMLFSALALRWPRVGGGVLIAAGVGFALWWLIPGIKSGFYSTGIALERLLLSGGFALVGVLFILDAHFNPRPTEDERPWAVRNLRWLFALGVPTLAALIVAGFNLPVVLTRVDDGDRSARLIEGNGVELIWAPAGPGWNTLQDYDGYPSWNMLAFYGVEPQGLVSNKLGSTFATEADMQETGICAYLNEAGTALEDQPVYIWRMPTTDEIVRSLSRHNENAGCAWNGETGKMECALRPDKETPLWAPDEPPVYFWTADEYDAEDAYYVSYTGFVSRQPKNWGNPRHGYRCVKDAGQ